jgi:hypothetical protein
MANQTLVGVHFNVPPAIGGQVVILPGAGGAPPLWMRLFNCPPVIRGQGCREPRRHCGCASANFLNWPGVGCVSNGIDAHTATSMEKGFTRLARLPADLRRRIRPRTTTDAQRGRNPVTGNTPVLHSVARYSAGFGGANRRGHIPGPIVCSALAAVPDTRA